MHHCSLTDLASTHTQINIWASQTYIGLTADPARKWSWSDGTPVDFTYWRAAQPDNYGGVEYCGAIDSHYNYNDIANWRYRWEDYECALPQRAFVCKRAA